MKMSNWITPKDLSRGIDDLPPIPINTQNYLRSQKKIQYTKVGRSVLYKKEWIEEYLERNMRKACSKEA